MRRLAAVPIRADRRDDDGTILILTIGFVVIAMLLVFAVVDASAVFLDRRDLSSAADGTALAAAQQVDTNAVYAQGATGDLPLDPAAVQRTVDTYVAQEFPPAQYPDWHFTVATGPNTVTVTTTRVVRLPVFGTVTVHATASATDRASVAREVVTSGTTDGHAEGSSGG